MSKNKKSSSRINSSRTSVEFLGLAAAVAFIASGAHANAVSERIPNQLRQEMSACLNNTGDVLQQTCKSDAATGKVYRFAQQSTDASTQDVYDFFNDSQGFFGYDWQLLPTDTYTLTPIDAVDTDIADIVWPRSLVNVFGKAEPNRCFSLGGAITWSYQARRLACWRSVKSKRVKLRVPPSDQKAYRALGNCKMRTHSITLRDGGFACVATPLAVMRASAKGAVGPPRKQPPLRPSKDPVRQ